METQQESAIDSLKGEWQQLDRQVRDLTSARDLARHAGALRTREQQLLLERRSEAREALRKLETCTPEEWRSAFGAAETAVGVLFHALWFVEHHRSESFADATGSHVLRPSHLLARSLSRRHGG